MDISRRNFIKSTIAALFLSQMPFLKATEKAVSIAKTDEELILINKIIKEMEQALIYGDAGIAPETFMGLQARFSQDQKDSNTAIWIVDWGEGYYPKVEQVK